MGKTKPVVVEAEDLQDFEGYEGFDDEPQDGFDPVPEVEETVEPEEPYVASEPEGWVAPEAPSGNPARAVIDELDAVLYRVQQDDEFGDVLNREAVVDSLRAAQNLLRVSA